MHYLLLFVLKVLDNALSTTKTILIQRNKSILAGIALASSTFINFWITKVIVKASSNNYLFLVSIASGFGCFIAILLSNKFSKEKTYVNIIMSDNKEAMQQLRDFLASKHITNVATDSYTKDWRKTITITAYPVTKKESKLLDDYLENNKVKFKRLIQEGII